MESAQNKQQLITKFNEIQAEILKIGWNGILEKYHPDVNCEDVDAAKTFRMYKSIYENMKKRMIVQC
ncbi:MAG: hypothetical protein GX270_00370 [Clostridiaceae bacterium]|jgi:DnaJ-class molecular chaperone|nr:hypothetical protein [Clostridiaceae bacterium]